MNMYKASFETEQNYPYNYNTTKKNPYKNSVYYNKKKNIYTGKK